jgi:hypothetical protein
MRLIFGTQSPVKNLSAIFSLSLLALPVQAALPQPDLIAQIHFAGGQKISTDAHSTAFTNEFCSTEALSLRAQTAAKLAGWLAGWLQTNLSTTVAESPAKLRPLFDDLQTSEWFLEARTAANGKPEVALAIKLNPARAQLWQANLTPFFPAAAFKSGGGWLIFDSDPALLKLGDRLAQKLSAPPAGWLDLDLSWPRLAQWYPELRELALPETQFTVTAPDDNFRINGKFYFAQNLALNLEPWRVPTNTLLQPFDSFTAVRGFASWFQSQTWAQPYQIAPVPNQLFVWALQSSLPFQTFAAVPVPDGANAFAQLYPRLASAFSVAYAHDSIAALVTTEMTTNGVGFIGMPYIAPYLRPLTEPAGQFLFWETFPNDLRGNPMPQEMLQRLETKNLVLYHWEITAQRMPQLLYLSQFGLMFTWHKQLDAGSAAFKWLQRIGGVLGNTDTEITQSGPAEFTFTRKAQGIFTGVELFTLANWLEATNFPGCDLRLPPPSERLKRLREQRMQHTKTISVPAPGH